MMIKQQLLRISIFGNLLAIGAFWLAVWLYRALLITLIGGVVGVLISPITKLLFFKDSGWIAVLKGGFVYGCAYVGLWASAIALVWVVMDRKVVVRSVARFFGT